MALDAVILNEIVRRANPVGTMAPFQNVGTEFTTPAGATWLRTGVAKAAAGYPQAAAEPSLQMFGEPVASPPWGSTIYDMASDGGDNYVMAQITTGTTSVYKSTDGGATWSTLAHNLGLQVCSVCWDATNALWIFAGNDTTNVKISTTPNLSTAATLRYTGSPTTPVANTAIVRSSGGNSVAICNAASGNTVAYSNNATAWTGVAAPTGTSPSGLAKLGSRWLYTLAASTGSYTSDDGGATWSAVKTAPASGLPLLAGNSLFLAVGASGVAYTSATGDTGTWTQINLSGGISAESPSASRAMGGYVDGVWRLASPAGIIETADLITTRIKRLPTDMSAQAPIAAFGTGGKFVIGYGTATPGAGKGSSLTTPTYVGTPKLLSTLATYAPGVPVYYVKIKG